jgi:hypothetical protein
MAKSKTGIDRLIRQNPHCLLISEISGNDKEEAERVLEQIKKKGKLNNVKYLKTKYNELKR